MSLPLSSVANLTLAGKPRQVGGVKRHFFTAATAARPMSELVSLKTAASDTVPSSWIVNSTLACASMRHNAILRAFYLRLREKGKPAKVALTAVMRKLTVLLNRLLKNPNFCLVQ